VATVFPSGERLQGCCERSLLEKKRIESMPNRGIKINEKKKNLLDCGVLHMQIARERTTVEVLHVAGLLNDEHVHGVIEVLHGRDRAVFGMLLD